ncbi:MAG: hypothetical protein R3A52_15125 [Polyangiales bacterium]
MRLRRPRQSTALELQYTVPCRGTLTLTSSTARALVDEPLELLITGRGFSLGVEDIALDLMQRGHDHLPHRRARRDPSSSGAETPDLALAFERPGADYLIELRSGAMTAG